jgi:anti-sigma regulatory factor (Ser/Thr protein kinase)
VPDRRLLQLPEARAEDLRAIRAFVTLEARSLGADDATIDDLVQAVDESATNVIRHGYRGMPGRLEVAVERSGAELIIALRDEAPPFDPTLHPAPDLEAPLMSRRPGGFGIHLARSCVDRVTHRVRVPQGNELRLIRHLEPSTQESHA